MTEKTRTDGYAALGPTTPAAEDTIELRLPDGFRITYADEIGDTHLDADSATYRLVWEHVTTNRPTIPRWLLDHLADVVSLVADLVEEAPELTSETRTIRRHSCAELLRHLFRHGARPWPIAGHGTRPLDDVAHCEDCAPFIGYAAPADVIAAEAAEDAKRTGEEAAYAAKLAAQLCAVEEEIAATYGEHVRAGQVTNYANPNTGKAEPAVVRSVYYRAPGEAGADVLLATGQPAGVRAQDLEPLRTS